MNNLSFILIFSLFLFVAGETLAQPFYSEPKTTEYESETPKIAIISLKINKSENQYTFSITNSTILNSTKNVEYSPGQWNENDFICFILDKQKQILDTLVIQQPLKARYEFPEDNKTIGSSTVELSENEILLRFKYNMHMKYLRFAKVGEEGKIEILSTIDFPNEN